MSTLGNLRKRYPLAEFEPMEDCEWCSGTGEREVHPKARVADGLTCCCCIFVSGHGEERRLAVRRVTEIMNCLAMSMQRSVT